MTGDGARAMLGMLHAPPVAAAGGGTVPRGVLEGRLASW